MQRILTKKAFREGGQGDIAAFPGCVVRQDLSPPSIALCSAVAVRCQEFMGEEVEGFSVVTIL